MSDSTSGADAAMRRFWGLVSQPDPKKSDGRLPSMHDLVGLEYSEAAKEMRGFNTAAAYHTLLDMFEQLCKSLQKDPAELMEARKNFGLEKYGTTLTAWNGRDSLADALDELADALVYLRCAIFEKNGS